MPKLGSKAIAVIAVAASFAVASLPHAARAAGAPSVTTDPALYPAFQTSVTDYVVRCAGGPSVTVSVDAPAGTKVAVDGAPARTGAFEVVVPLRPNESFSFVVTVPTGTATATTTHAVRCLPADFPTWTATRTGTTAAKWYVVTPSSSLRPPEDVSRRYVIVFDNNGVPVWWYRDGMPGAVPIEARMLPNGNIGWLHFPEGRAEEHRLDGTTVRVADTVGAPADPHELLLLPNGNYVLPMYLPKSGVDLRPIGGPRNATILDGVIQELRPDGTVAWSWHASDHIPVQEVPRTWWPLIAANRAPYDIYHLNGYELDGDGLIVSFQRLDAVYRVARPSGAVSWKLGGAQRPESLAVSGDPLLAASGGFAGPHDPRLGSDGSLSVHDNGTMHARPPRAVRYAIDAAAKSATLLEQRTDPEAPVSICCGSARRIGDGNWVMSWGGNSLVTEWSAAGERVFKLGFGDGLWSYRAQPLLPTQADAGAFRQGMDRMHPRLISLSPSSMRVVTGARTAGDVPELAADDDAVVEVRSTPSPTAASADKTAWYARFGGVSNALRALKVSFAGSNSSSCTQRLWLWNWATSGWNEVDRRTVGAAEQRIDRWVPGPLGDFVSGTSGNGEVRLLVTCVNAAGGFVARGDMAGITFSKP